MPTKGKLLIAEPFLNESSFKRSVVLITEHGHNGTVGFILNKPSGLMLNDFFQDFPDFSVPVFLGGPVEQDRLNYIHRLGKRLKGSIQVCKGVYWGGSFDDLKLLIETGQVEAADIRFFLGYSGWYSAQLESELAFKSWILTNATDDFIFKKDPEQLWRTVLNSMGARYSVFAAMPDDISLN